MRSPFFVIATAIFSFVFIFSANASPENNGVATTLPPSWVETVKLPSINSVPEDKIQNGVHYLLFDTQIRADEGREPIFYHHNADYIVNQAGVEQSSQINIGYSPGYQHVELHFLRIIRGDVAIDKMASARMELLQREENMDDLIYNGRITLNIILDDVRVGDIVEYGFSRKGMNPVYQNIFSYSQYLSWSVPVGRISFRLHWNKSVPLQYKVYRSDLKLLQQKTAGGSEYLISGDNISPVSVENNTPTWFEPWGRVQFSELASWQEVARWSEQLYENLIVIDPSVQRLVDEIKITHSGKEEQISAALRFVQDEIRYLGIELGENSHKPTAAVETLKNRYGDCKDKTVLFLSLLKGLGVEAYPALVNTESNVKDVLANIRAFDHVITYMKYRGKSYWLDPTRSFQYGALDTVHQPDFGYALILSPSSIGLTSMASQPSKYGVFVKDQFDLRQDGTAVFSTHSEYFGWNAERQRRNLANKGSDKIQREYLEFFQRYYPSTEIKAPIELLDDVRSNRFFTKENYLIEEFWEDRPDKKRNEAAFYSYVIGPVVDVPDELSRKYPLYLVHPEHVKQVIELTLTEEDWRFDDESFVEDNEFFHFEYEAKFEQNANKLILIYEYKSKADFVPAEKYQDYTSALQVVETYQNYSIFKSYSAKTEAGSAEFSVWQYLTLTNILVAYGSLYFLVFLLWRLDRHRRPDVGDVAFYPVSFIKLVVMWVITFGVYGMYWFYRNFRYIKENEQNSTIPVARGIFYSFWYYGLWDKLKGDSEDRFGKLHLPGRFLALGLSTVFLVVGFAANKDEIWLLSLLVSALLVLPLANYISFVNDSDSADYIKNSKWHFRHGLLIVLSVPLCVMSMGAEVGLLPHDAVVKGSRLLEHDVKFLQRNGVIKPQDDIQYFYSDAFLLIRNDGNGFTQRHVFSYWKDENDRFNSELASYEEIKDIQVAWSKDQADTTVVTIVRNDGSNFLLYVSNSDKKDKLFVNGLMEQWEGHR